MKGSNRKYFPRSTTQSQAQIEITFDKPFYSGGEEVSVDVKFKSLTVIQNVTKIYWEISGAEYVSWEVLGNNIQTTYSNGERYFLNKTSIFGTKKETKDFEEGEEHNWQAKFILPTNLSPTFKTSFSRIDYYFKVIVEQLLPTTQTTTSFQTVKYFTVVKPFDPEEIFEQKNEVNVQGEGKSPSPSLKRRFLGDESTSSMVEVKIETIKNIYCPIGDPSPSFPIKLILTSKATTPILDFRVALARKTTVKTDNNSTIERRVCFSQTFPLDPPLAPSETREYKTDVVIPQNLNPSVDTKLTENTYILTVQVKMAILKTFLNLTTAPKDYNPVIVAKEDEDLTRVGIGASLITQLKTSSPSPSKWTSREVASYLSIRGLADYKRVLEKNKIDGEALLALDESRYEALGITKLGDVVKLTKLIEELKMKDQLMEMGEKVEDIEPIEVLRYATKNEQLKKKSLRHRALAALQSENNTK